MSNQGKISQNCCILSWWIKEIDILEFNITIDILNCVFVLVPYITFIDVGIIALYHVNKYEILDQYKRPYSLRLTSSSNRNTGTAAPTASAYDWKKGPIKLRKENDSANMAIIYMKILFILIFFYSIILEITYNKYIGNFDATITVTWYKQRTKDETNCINQVTH